MEHKYTGDDPLVISEDMISQAILEQSPKGEPEPVIAKEPLKPSDVRELTLNYRRILRIENLWELKLLTRLQLDNNWIERIENLGAMVNLQWLDLSFNRIEKIEGLSKLTELEDLSLYSNHIESIENLETLNKLQVLSIGKNRIEKLEEGILHIRPLKSLRSLNLAENPCCENPKYYIYIAAFLQKLEYLDYRLVTKESKEAGCKEYKDTLEEMEIWDARAVEDEENEIKRDEELEVHVEAFVDGLDDDYFFNKMQEEDKDGLHLICVPGAEEIIEPYKELFLEICRGAFVVGMTSYEERSREVEQITVCLNEAKNEVEERGSALIEEFLIDKEVIFEEALTFLDDYHREGGTNDRLIDAIEERLQYFFDKCQDLWDELMASEVVLNEQLEDVISEFGRNVSEMVNAFLETLQGQFSQLRDLHSGYHEQMSDFCQTTSEHVSRGDNIELPPETVEIYMDKDKLINVLTNSNDVRLQLIDKYEDQLIQRAKGWLTKMTTGMLGDEEQRDRDRVIEINQFVDKQREELDDFIVPSKEEEEDPLLLAAEIYEME